MFPQMHQKLKNRDVHQVVGFEKEFPPYTSFIVNRLIINSHERVIPDWDTRKIRGLPFEIKTATKFQSVLW